MLGVAPAQERLDASQPPALQIDLWLVVQQELVVLDRAAHLTEQDQPRCVEAVLVGGEGLDPAAVRFCTSKRRIGALQQRVEVLGVLPHQREPYARLDAEHDAIVHDRRLEARQDQLRSRFRARDVRHPRAEDRVLVATEPRDERLGGEARAQTTPDLDQHAIADLVAERVVDHLEPIEIDKQQRRRAVAAPFAAQNVRDPLDEERPVGQARELVVASERVVVLRLAAQAARCARDDPIQDRPHERQPDRDEQRDRARIGAECGSERAVAEVDLERPRRPFARSEPQWHVDLDQASEAHRAGRLRIPTGGDDVGVVGPAGERMLEIVAWCQRAPDERVVI